MSDQSMCTEKLCDLPLQDREEISSLIARLQQAQQEVLQRGFTTALITLHSMSDVRSVQLEGERPETPAETEARLARAREAEQLNQEADRDSMVTHLRCMNISREDLLALWEAAQKTE